MAEYPPPSPWPPTATAPPAAATCARRTSAIRCAWPAGWRPNATTVACSSSTCVTRQGRRPTCQPCPGGGRSRGSRSSGSGETTSPAGAGPAGAGPGVRGFLQGDHRARVVQLVCHPGGPASRPCPTSALESSLSVTGKVVARPPATVNPRLADRIGRGRGRQRRGPVFVRRASLPCRAGQRGRRGSPPYTTATWTCAGGLSSNAWPRGLASARLSGPT